MLVIPVWFKPAAWGAITGAVAITLVGFTADWVMMNGSAVAMADDAAETAVLSALTPVCVARFEAASAPVREAQLAAMEDEASWKRGDVVEAQGWATMPGMDDPHEGLARVCTTRILKDAAAA